MPRVVEVNEVFYWLRPGESFTLKGKPTDEEERTRNEVKKQIIAFLEAKHIARTTEIDSYCEPFPKAAHLAEESEIVWLRNPKEFPYLRQNFAKLSRRDTPCPTDMTNGELIGYAKLTRDAKAFHGHYFRRYFWFKTDGRDPFKSGFPGEAVKVSSIRVGFPAVYGRD